VGQLNGFVAVILDCDHLYETATPVEPRSQAAEQPCYLVSLVESPGGQGGIAPHVRLRLPEAAVEPLSGNGS
jgi:hypothetical protein